MMKACIIAYSMSGNNSKLASYVATKGGIDLIELKELSERKIPTIIMDFIFKRTPQVNQATTILENYDFVLLMGPVWMGQPATPLRSFIKELKKNEMSYGFASISGGAQNDNPKLKDHISKMVKRTPDLFFDFHIVDLIEGQSSMKDTSSYAVTKEDVALVGDKIVDLLEHT